MVKAVILFQQNKLSEAYGIIKNLNRSDLWYEQKTDFVWVVQKAIIEILLLIELDKLDLVESRLKSFNRKFKKRLEQRQEARVITFMRLVKRYFENPQEITSTAFRLAAEKSFVPLALEQQDLFILSFYAWLKSKMEGVPLYKATLKYIDF